MQKASKVPNRLQNVSPKIVVNGRCFPCTPLSQMGVKRGSDTMGNRKCRAKAITSVAIVDLLVQENV